MSGTDISGIVMATPQRSALSGADSDALATFVAAYGAASDCEERGSIVGLLTFDTNARTAGLRALFFDRSDNLLGMSDEYNCNATPVEANATPRYLGPTVYIPCQGYPRYRLKLETLSGGTANMHHGTQL